MGEVEAVIACGKGIAFDLEGTIVNIESLHYDAHLKAAADLGVELELKQAIAKMSHFVGGPDESVAAEFCALQETSCSTEKYLQLKREYFRKSFSQLGDIEAREGFAEFFAWVQGRGVKVAIGTVTRRHFALQLLERTGLLDMVNLDLLVAREDIDSPKPAPDVFFETAKRMGIMAGKQCVFEDSIVGVKAAKAAGSMVIAVPTVKGKTYRDGLLKAGAEMVFSEWTNNEIRTLVDDYLCK